MKRLVCKALLRRQLLGLLLGLCAQAALALDATPKLRSPELDLDGIVQTVVQHNPELQATQHQQEQAAAGIVSARALPNPRLEWGSGWLRPAQPTGPSGNLESWGVAQLLENPSLRQARVDAARHGLQATAALVAQVRAEVMAQARLRAFEYLLRLDETQAASAELDLLEQTRERVRVRVASGEAARYESIKADAEFISARQRKQTAELAVEQARIRLNQLAGGQLPPGWRLRASLDTPLQPRQRELLQARLVSRHPELLGLRATLEQQQARVQEAQAGRWPGVELRYTELREPDNRQSMVGASIQIPLLDQRQGAVAEAQAGLLRARTRLESRQTDLLLQLDAAWSKLEMAQLRVEALASGAIREAEAALQVAQAAYRFGERGILDVLDAQRVLRTVRADLLQARFQQQAAAIEIDLLTGHDVPQP